MVELEEGEKWLPLAVVTIQINISLGELTAIFNMLCHQVGGPPPCPALRGERGGGKPGEEEPGGKEDGAHISFEDHCFHSNFWFLSLCSYFDQQELWSETIHSWLTAE